MSSDRTPRQVYAAAAALFIAFAVWGSLFPFDFQPVPWRVAVVSFWSAWDVPVARWSVSDLVSNVLLFVPIGLFAAAWCQARVRHVPGTCLAPGRTAFALWRILVVLCGSAILSTAIELAQAFVPWRTPSAVDVGAETIGAAAGVAIWCVVHGWLDALVAAATATVRRAPIAERVLLAYCGIFAAAWLVPADFTLRPNEIADKYVHKRLLLPFTPSPDAVSARGLAMVGAVAMPIGITTTLCGCGGAARRRLRSAVLIATTFLVGLEAAQVFVFSRTTDATALVTAIIAANVGAVVVTFTARHRPIAPFGIEVR